MIFQSLGSYVFVSFLVGDLIGISTIILDNLNSIRNLSFSRKFETEADDNACKLMIERGIDPKGMLELFEILSDQSGAEKQNIPTFLSTHPLTKDRIHGMREKINSHSESVNENIKLKAIFERLKQKD
jgi:predicted Zn-dependent protease